MDGNFEARRVSKMHFSVESMNQPNPTEINQPHSPYESESFPFESDSKSGDGESELEGGSSDELEGVREVNGGEHVGNEGDEGGKSGGDNLSNVNEDRVSEGPNEVSSSNDEETYTPTPGIVFRVGDDGKIRLQKGHLFRDFRHFREIIGDYAIQEGFRLKKVKNERRRIVSQCEANGCPWVVRGSPTRDRLTYQLKSITDVHTCLSVYRNNQVTSNWIGKHFETVIKESPKIGVDVLGQMVLRQFGVIVPSYTLYRAINFALNIGNEDHKHSFNKLHRYGYILRERNPGTTAFVGALRVNPDPNVPAHFQRFFLSFHSQKMGYLEGCRPFIGLDGCHLKGPYEGILLCAIGIDANGGVYPLAIGVCEKESRDTWTWFLGLLYDHIGQYETRTVCFMSDRQKGIGLALDDCWANHRNRNCARHILQNMLSKYKIDYLPEFFWQSTRASNVGAFNEAMVKIKETSTAAYQFLMNIPLHLWSIHAFDTETKCDHITNNIVETFNGWLNKPRELPVLSMLEVIRKKLMTRIQERHENALTWESEIPPEIRKLIQKHQHQGRHLATLRCGKWEFEVVDGNRQFGVYLDKKWCECGLWAVSGVPCKHAMACISKIKGDVEPYVDNYLKRSAYLKTYSYVIHAVPDESLWPNVEAVTLLPPIKTRRAGRPKKSRKKGATEPSHVQRSVGLRCSICQQTGHNQRTCKEKGTGTGKRKQIEASSSTTAGSSAAVVSSSAPSRRRLQQTMSGPSNANPNIGSQDARVTGVLWLGLSQTSVVNEGSQTQPTEIRVNPTEPPSQQSQPSQMHFQD